MRHAEDVTFGAQLLDRATALRGDATKLAAARSQARVLLFWQGKPLVADGALAWLPADHPVLTGDLPQVLLGMATSEPCFAADLSDWEPEPEQAEGSVVPGTALVHHPQIGTQAGFADLRGIMARLTPAEAELAATGKAVLHWHRSHGFCAACGERTRMTQGGWQRHCQACDTPHFPRTDPVVIMLVTHGNSVLLGRSPGWPEGMFSLLAGFMEPGETIEAAVRREVLEETGVHCLEVGYLASQPWPFPASLMIGARTEARNREITLDPVELEAARWASREELVTVLAGIHPEIRPFRAGAIAEFLLRNWLADRLD